MKKRILTAALTAALALGLWGCQEKTGSDKSLYDHGLEIISLMDEMAGSELYFNAVFSPNSEIGETVKSMGREKHTVPQTVYKITAPNLLEMAFAESGASEDFAALSEPFQNLLESKADSIIINQINAMGGATTLAASTAFIAEKTFVSDELEENVIYLYVYEDAVLVGVIFTGGEDQTVSATGMFIFNEDFKVETEEEIKEFLKSFSVEVEKLSL